MNENLNLALLVLILQLSISYTFTNAEPLYVSCSDDTNASNYTANGTFEDNLKLILDSLPSSTSHTGFNNTLIGEIPDQVYGQGLCRGDVNSTVCYNCIRKATKEIVRDCDSKQAMIWYDLCQVHYSFQNFFSKNTFTGKFPEWNKQKKSMPNSVHFNRLLNYLLHNLTVEASSDTSSRMFAVGEIKVSKYTNIYGLVQCTPDIQSSECNNCLSSAFTELDACCHAREGGMVLGRNCNLRYELRRFYDASSILLTYPSSKENKWNTGTIVGIICIPAFFLTVVIVSCVVYFKHKKGALEDGERSEQALIQELSRPTSVTLTEEGVLVSSQDFTFLHLPILRAATKDFSDSNKLGRGGFGTVYKGVLPNGKEIAVKRLSKKSWQGLEELKNEIILIAKLQHRNLVKLLGCGIEGDEKLLIYEFMPNQSLDMLIFDSKRRSVLDWKMCFDIICGIARGLNYLHEDSWLRIIHRDLKPSNVLLDEEMVAKISDFGMARIFCEDQNTANTRRVVGTYGYMAPEYAMEGLFSVKSDVFSFGVILLEIISGKRNSDFYVTRLAQTLLAHAWNLWNEGKIMELVHPALMESCSLTADVLQCIHIGLLCVQENPADRPTMSFVIALLGSESIALPQPKQPAFSVSRIIPSDKSSATDASTNFITVSSISPR